MTGEAVKHSAVVLCSAPTKAGPPCIGKPMVPGALCYAHAAPAEVLAVRVGRHLGWMALNEADAQKRIAAIGIEHVSMAMRAWSLSIISGHHKEIMRRLTENTAVRRHRLAMEALQ
jgi:hypothetical protein